jgi:hypothetical protein
MINASQALVKVAIGTVEESFRRSGRPSRKACPARVMSAGVAVSTQPASLGAGEQSGSAKALAEEIEASFSAGRPAYRRRI